MSTQPQGPAAPSKGAVSTLNKTPSSKHYQGEHVIIIVGSDKKKFTVHKDLLVFYSDYFRAAFNGSFAEATEKKIELLDIDQEVFEHFNAWLYTRELVSEDKGPLDSLILVDLWIFGDRYQVPMFQNYVMDEILATGDREEYFDLHMCKPAYRKTVNGSLLRKAIIHLLVYRTKLGDEEGSAMAVRYRHIFTIEILQDIIREMDAASRNKVPYGKTPKRDKCFFHVHNKDEHC